jgi:RNA polymerase sigma-70 factor (ECF subfamily)|tara:strand:+ start:2916 stop:3386 length:471 start_codon:yes stop_codon:yes gene_type:complete
LERYYSEVLSYIARSVGCKDKAQNIVQEAYTRLLSYHRSNPKQDRTQERALFFKAAKNIVIDQYRKNQPIAEPDEVELIAPSFYEPEAKLASQQQLALLNRSIESLPLKTKQAFVLYKFKNLNQAQIAEQMGISVSMVEKHLATAMLACRQALKKQ